jgi:hypothetical protein
VAAALASRTITVRKYIIMASRAGDSQHTLIIVPPMRGASGVPFDEPAVLRVGAAYEAAAGRIDKRPSLAQPIAVDAA